MEVKPYQKNKLAITRSLPLVLLRGGKNDNK